MSEGGAKNAVWLVVAAVIGGGFLLSQCDDSSDSIDASSSFSSSSDDSSDSSDIYTGTSLSTDPAVLTRQESQSLADRLEAAHDAQQICYGWRINDAEVGSNFGPGSSVADHTDCFKFVELDVDYVYNSVDEEFTGVMYSIQSAGVTLDKADLTAAGIDTDELLDEPNVAVSNAVGLLPVLVAEKGQAPAVPVPEGQQNTGGNTVERTFDLQWVWLVLAIILLGGGLVWVIVGLIRGRRRSARDESPDQERPEWLPPLPPQPQQSPQQPQPEQQQPPQQQPRPQQGNDQGTDQGMGSQ